MKFENVEKTYRYMQNTVFSRQYHVAFCTHGNKALLIGEVASRLEELILEQQNEYHYEVLSIGILPNCVHLVLDITTPKDSIYVITNHIKNYTARTLRSEFSSLRSRIPAMWTRSKFISSIGTVALDDVMEYIKDQHEKK